MKDSNMQIIKYAIFFIVDPKLPINYHKNIVPSFLLNVYVHNQPTVAIDKWVLWHKCWWIGCVNKKEEMWHNEDTC